jgi:hypothetical protein
MFTILSLVTSVKDYIEIVHKLVETNNSNPFEISSYYDFGAILTYLVLSGKEVLSAIFTFKWLQNIASLPLIVPEISAAMLSEISVLDGYFHNAFTFLETPLSYGNQNILFYSIEKFSIGLINSIFLCLPTSTAHIITLRRFIMQGLEAGYLAGLGTLAGNVLWIGSILFGLRFIVIPWLSLDILRYGLGFLLLVKYMWDSYSEKRTVLEDLSKWKIFLLNFLLAFTEQATIYPFLSNLSIGSDATILESFPAGSFGEYTFIHFCYLGGLIVGSLSLLQLSCWFWENPAFNIYMWAMSSLKLTNTISQRFVNLCFLYLTMFFAVSNISYFGLDYTVTNPLGFVHEDRLIEQKSLLETSFLNTKASDRNTRRNRGRHGRRERWKRRVRRYRTFDASLYDQGVYDLFTIEDLNYGFDRFWLRRKIRNHRVRFRFFPGPWMRSFKKQLARPRLESFMGPRVEFFRILFEQSYHPEFHEFRTTKSNKLNTKTEKTEKTILNDKNAILLKNFKTNNLISSYSEKNQKIKVDNLRKEYSALRKFVRKINTRTNSAEILLDLNRSSALQNNSAELFEKKSGKAIYSKRWKQIFSKISHNVNDASMSKGLEKALLNKFYKQTLLSPISTNLNTKNYMKNFSSVENQPLLKWNPTAKQNSEKQLSKKDRQILRYKTFLTQNSLNSSLDVNKTKMQSKFGKISNETQIYEPLTLLHPIKFYLQKEQAFKKKMKFYGASLFRNFGIENNAPYYRVMMKKFFYYYKPTLRWERTMRTATMRKARRKGPRVPRKLNINKKTQMLANGAVLSNNMNSTVNLTNSSARMDETTLNTGLSYENLNSQTKIQKPTHFYSLVSKRATRYRYQIYKDVLQHWYYSPFNRLLLKFDVDSFIRRQPTSHFLTKKEENLLHLKRYLLSDYYNTLRWYSYMQHYDSMKTNIGKTKSFASRSYNQQFFGTFKKIRHLFAVTPSLSENNVLKFDQPLFNEYKNTEKTFNKNYSLYDSSWIHEELLADEDLYSTTKVGKNLPEDLPTQSTKILKEYVQKAQPIRQEYIQKLLEEQNYAELTRFLFKGEKIRGTIPVTNETSLLDQEKNYLLATEVQNLEKEKIQNFFRDKIFNQSFVNTNNTFEATGTQDPRYLWISLMKKSRNMLYNQEALKLYVAGRVEKLEKQKKRQEKVFQARLTNMKNWVALQPDLDSQTEFPASNQLSGLTSSLQKAVKEGIYYQMSGSLTGKNLEKSNLRNNREKVLTNLPVLERSNENLKTKKRKILTKVSKTNLSVNLKNHLENRVRLRAVQAFNAEQDIRKNFSRIQEIVKKENPDISLKNLNPNLANKIVNATLLPFKYVSVSIVNKLQTLTSSNTGNVILQPLRATFKVLTKNREKSLKNWKQKETVLSTRKKIRRKIYRVLDQKRQIQKMSNVQELENLGNLNNSPLRQKQDRLEKLETEKNKKSWNQYEKANLKKWAAKDATVSNGKESAKSVSSNFFSNFFEKNFKRKRTRSRRYRRFKGRGPIKKHTLAEKLKRQFKLLKRYGDKDKGQDKKIEILQMITKREYNPNTFFEPRETKQRRTRQSKHRYWKKHKRQKYLQMKRKQRKRRRYSISKLRVLNKEFKRIQSQVELKNWWWQTFLPNFMTTTDAFWQIEKNKQIKQEFEKLSINDILERDELTRSQQPTAMLQIGNQDFKPLGVPEALRLRANLVNKGELTFGTEKMSNDKLNSEIFGTQNSTNLNRTNSSNENFISNLSQNLLENQTVSSNLLNTTTEAKKFVNVNPMPFYAGWDETLRQFVVTNRLLSRKEAGYTLNLPNNNSNLKMATQNGEFTKAPLQGMNAATTLYWQIPFTTYDPDQFFALGMDGFSPLGWRFFNFKHSKQTTKPILVQNILYKNEKEIQNQSLLSYNLQMKMMNLQLQNKGSSFSDSKLKTNNISKNQNRKIQKRQKRVKKHPRPPVWFPSGALANQVLPVHYIYVFYKRTRLPRDRYIGRRLRRADDPKASFIKANFTKMLDFTLRKRVKPIRKYHRKRSTNKNQETSLILRRRPFKTLINENPRFRPIAKTRLTTQTDILNSSLLKTKQRKKSLTTKPNSENLRIRQLRRRIQRQVLRPILRYKPRAGGIVWPGDYLRLETVKVPVLNNLEASKTNLSSVNSSNSQIRKKKRRAIQEWQIQPKKYLREKHNLKVLKKRLQKSQNFNNLSQKIKELNLTL